MDTIFALASAQGRSGVAVIRISGPRAEEAASLFVRDLPMPRRAALRKLRHEGEVIDEALVLYFPEGQSFTGEKVVEFQTHGSPAVVAALLRVLGDSGIAHPAQAGEFTRQALLNGRLDLTQVEALGDLLSAETEAQRRQAQRILSGALADRAAGWRHRLVQASALVEAGIDFSDEELPPDIWAELGITLRQVCSDLKAELTTASGAERVREGFEVAIIGAPNVGKSTLLNRLAGREVAITSEIAGTTRDVVEVRLDIAGLPVTLLDTAGLRESEDRIEQIGMARARDRAAGADLRVFLTESGDLPVGISPLPDDLIYRAKGDIGGAEHTLPSLSGLTGAGVDGLLHDLAKILSARVSPTAVLNRERHRLAVREAAQALEHAFDVSGALIEAPEVVAEEVRTALRALDMLVGRVDVEDILGEIFSAFCIGK